MYTFTVHCCSSMKHIISFTIYFCCCDILPIIEAIYVVFLHCLTFANYFAIEDTLTGKRKNVNKFSFITLVINDMFTFRSFLSDVFGNLQFLFPIPANNHGS